MTIIYVVLTILFFESYNQIHLTISILLFLGVTVIWFVYNNVVKKFNVIGNIVFLEQELVINDSMHIELLSAERVVIKIAGYDGESYGGRTLMGKDGSGNIIKIVKEENILQYEFYIDSVKYYSAINYFYNAWKKEGIDVELLDFYGKNVESIVP